MLGVGLSARRGPAWTLAIWVGGLCVTGSIVAGAPPTFAASLAPAAGASIPVGSDGAFLRNLTPPDFVGSSEAGSLTFNVGNPQRATLTNVSVQFDVYGFATSLGSAVSAAPSPGVSFACPLPSGANAGCRTLTRVVPIPDILPGKVEGGGLAVQSDPGAASGFYLISSELTFAENGTQYRFESRHHFSSDQWDRAALPNGSNGAPGLNLSLLGVDGVTPETSIIVTAPNAGWPIYGLAAAGTALLAIGAYALWRRGPGSRSGASDAPEPQSAPSAFGKNRTSEGERIRS